MPQGIYSEIGCSGNPHSEFKANPHQKETMKYFLKSKFKGLLLYHQLGSGKTCTSIMIADKMMKKGLVKHVYIFTPGSLRSGWISEYCNTCGKDFMPKSFTFITYNYMVGNRLPDLNNSLVIIDEVHNLINGVKNGSTHSTLIYKAMKNAKCRILALSGTPIFHYLYEWPILGNLLKPGEFPEIIRGDEIDSDAWLKFFDIGDDGTIKPKNKTKVKRMLEGIVSYFPGSGADYYPTVIHMSPIKVVMSDEQERYYWVKHEQEKRLSRPPNKKLFHSNRGRYELLKRLYIMAKKNILTRAASNFYYGKYKTKKDALVEDGGWIKEKRFKHRKLGKIYSMKIVALLLNILLHPRQKHVVFTFFKEKSGVYLIHSLLKMADVKSFVFTGDLNDSQRSRVLKNFNKRENRKGKIAPILLVTEAGAEGISIMEARHMHILESGPRESKIQQAIGRIARYKSHYKMPKSQQNVKIWRYWSMATIKPITIRTDVFNPNGTKEYINRTITNKGTIDQQLYERGQIAMNKINSFLDLLKQVSVTEYKEI